MAQTAGIAGPSAGSTGVAWLESKGFLLVLPVIPVVLLTLSERVRFRARRLARRYFRMPPYNFVRVARSLAEAKTRCADPFSFCTAVEKLVSETFQALSVSIWLVDTGKLQLKFAGSTSVFQSQAERCEFCPEQVTEVLLALRRKAGPINIDLTKEPWAATLRRLQPAEFMGGGDRISIPLVAGGEVLGVMIVGDRVGGSELLVQDAELLKLFADQAAATVLRLQLAARLALPRQIEACQPMPTLFVSQFGVTASANSLILGNLSFHCQEPSLKEHAFRGHSRTLTG